MPEQKPAIGERAMVLEEPLEKERALKAKKPVGEKRADSVEEPTRKQRARQTEGREMTELCKRRIPRIPSEPKAYRSLRESSELVGCRNPK